MTSKRTALITGGTGCLGRAIAVALHDAGHDVIVTYHSSEAATRDWIKEEAAKGRTFSSYKVDVADFDACQALARRLEEDGRQIDILVNNAGITRDASLRKMSAQDWADVMHSNLDSMFNMTQPLCGPMADRGWGRIVNISSVNGSKGAFGQTNYAASKAGIHGFTKSLALEMARKGVTVNTVSPGYLATRMVQAVPPEVMQEKILPQIPVGRLGEPDEIAALVAFICSDVAGFMTGSNVAMNGGQHMY
ncbi:acetoacetyl-CoA reductase [Achromobacter mucicolens]|uniref:Acetoacetyl-CoA reductase n=1 Tax=Achromobacter mucicolens TaxID=1389922 RepID=A0ABD4YNY5_9BURK|nr:MULTISPECIES: acetoacetyl-CoA reductase [Achromobacter]MCU6615593.1 acetoacetyl-CoA reductase [Achromobacter mucicolens]MDH1177117.1 acetoacetyl-CoA reductase [Achromobacter mucicolens]UDG75077.1 acetoacetyl-CoA reductase [Achromobacter sp. 77]CAB3827813.1 Acetoacetyl-CoA reductase [Achromobacter mucicolens]